MKTSWDGDPVVGGGGCPPCCPARRGEGGGRLCVGRRAVAVVRQVFLQFVTGEVCHISNISKVNVISEITIQRKYKPSKCLRLLSRQDVPAPSEDTEEGSGDVEVVGGGRSGGCGRGGSGIR